MPEHQPDPIKTTPQEIPGERLLTQTELADLWQVKPRTIEGWRRRRVGPVYIQIERQVRYRLADIETYKAARAGRNSPASRATKCP